MARHNKLQIWNPLTYLSEDESKEIGIQLAESLKDTNCVLFWTGLSYEIVTRWAQKQQLKTLAMAMGPLMDPTNPNSIKCKKGKAAFSKYVKGASIKFAEYACLHGQAIVLTHPPHHAYNPRENSTYQELEEPILKGKFGNNPIRRIYYVHPTVTEAAHMLYQVWPIDRHTEWNKLYGAKQVRRKLQAMRWEERSLVTTSQTQFSVQALHYPTVVTEKLANPKMEPTNSKTPASLDVRPRVGIKSQHVVTSISVKQSDAPALDEHYHRPWSDNSFTSPRVFDFCDKNEKAASIELFYESEDPSRSAISIMRCLAPVIRHSAPVVNLQDLIVGSDVTIDLGKLKQSGTIFLKGGLQAGGNNWWALQWV